MRPDEIEPGYVAIAELNRDQGQSAFAVTHYDEHGKVLHVWPVDCAELDPNGPRPLNVMLNGLEMFSYGSIAVALDEGRMMARLDSCGKPIWISRGGHKHMVSRDSQGYLLRRRNDAAIALLDTETGKAKPELGLRKTISPAGSDQLGILSILSHVYTETW